MTPRHDRTWVEISRVAVSHNFRAIQKFVGSVPLAPVVKANAYGHGLFAISQILQQEKKWGLCVAYGSEALQLRRHGHKGKILVLSFWQPSELPDLIRHRIDIVVWDEPSLRMVVSLPSQLRQRTRIHIKLDSGTSRIGFVANQMPMVSKALQHARIQPVGIFSHLANSEERPRARTNEQNKRFTTQAETLHPKRGTIVHLACTAAALRYPEARFGLIRLGIGLYGLWPSVATESEIGPFFKLHPTLQWKSRISQIKSVTRGTAVGYGGTWITKKRSLIATIPVGYGDGYLRSWSNRAWVIINGHRAKVIGRVAMNLIMVDVTNISHARRGHVVTLIGPGVRADDLASLGATMINYEVTTLINPTIPRIIV